MLSLQKEDKDEGCHLLPLGSCSNTRLDLHLRHILVPNQLVSGCSDGVLCPTWNESPKVNHQRSKVITMKDSRSVVKFASYTDTYWPSENHSRDSFLQVLMGAS